MKQQSMIATFYTYLNKWINCTSLSLFKNLIFTSYFSRQVLSLQIARSVIKTCLLLSDWWLFDFRRFKFDFRISCVEFAKPQRLHTIQLKNFINWISFSRNILFYTRPHKCFNSHFKIPQKQWPFQSSVV